MKDIFTLRHNKLTLEVASLTGSWCGGQDWPWEDVQQQPSIEVTRVVCELLPDIREATGELWANGFGRIFVGGDVSFSGLEEGRWGGFDSAAGGEDHQDGS